MASLSQDRLKLLLTLYDGRSDHVAQALGVSKSYISLVLNCRTKASPELIARIERAIVDSGADSVSAAMSALESAEVRP